jgi:hypothetical protein
VCLALHALVPGADLVVLEPRGPAPRGRRRRYAWGVLYVAREDRPERHRGIVVRLHRGGSVFAPPAAALRFQRPETRSPAAFRVVYLRHLRALWRRAPRAFLDLLDLAGGGADVTLVDDFGDAPAAPRTLLAAALKQLAKTRRDEARRKAWGAQEAAAGAPIG